MDDTERVPVTPAPVSPILCAKELVPLPQTRGRNLQQMVVRITEVYADATPRPLRPPFQGNTCFREMLPLL